MRTMNIDASEKEVVLCLDYAELIEICNALHYAEKSGNKRQRFYRLYGNLMLARDLCQYGNIDNFSLKKIQECRNKIEELDAEVK